MCELLAIYPWSFFLAGRLVGVLSFYFLLFYFLWFLFSFCFPFWVVYSGKISMCVASLILECTLSSSVR